MDGLVRINISELGRAELRERLYHRSSLLRVCSSKQVCQRIGSEHPKSPEHRKPQKINTFSFYLE